jgi:hypothetical protein
VDELLGVSVGSRLVMDDEVESLEVVGDELLGTSVGSGLEVDDAVDSWEVVEDALVDSEELLEVIELVLVAVFVDMSAGEAVRVGNIGEDVGGASEASEDGN